MLQFAAKNKEQTKKAERSREEREEGKGGKLFPSQSSRVFLSPKIFD
jgi:hypothetical protein